VKTTRNTYGENANYNALFDWSKNASCNIFRLIWLLFIYHQELKTRGRIDEIYKWIYLD